jgi:hypothetical protein
LTLPLDGTCQMSQLSASSTEALSFVHPIVPVGGLTTLWSFSVLTKETGAFSVMLRVWPDSIE